MRKHFRIKMHGIGKDLTKVKLFRLILLSMLNFKDMLDIIDMMNIPENPHIIKLTSFFSIFDCMQSKELYSLENLIQENFKISNYFQNLIGISSNTFYEMNLFICCLSIYEINIYRI